MTMKETQISKGSPSPGAPPWKRRPVKLLPIWEPKIGDVLMEYDSRDPFMQPRARGRISRIMAQPAPMEPRLAFVRSPEGISIELLQSGDALPAREPWASMESEGDW